MTEIWLYLSIVILSISCWKLYQALQHTQKRVKTLNHELEQLTHHVKAEAAKKIILQEQEHLMEKAVESGTALVGTGTSSAETIHKAISGITFDILESIPVTKDTARVVRTLHDKTADAVYSLVRSLNQNVGDASRNLLTSTPSDH